jgi:hypothetical protein
MDKKLLEKYREYAASEESKAILFVKQNLKASKNKWIDIIECFRPNGYIDYYNDDCNFKRVVCELFDRHDHPKYPKKEEKMSDKNYYLICRAITWETANNDIMKQRERGVEGPTYEIKGKKTPKKNKSIFVEDAPDEIKELEKDLNDFTSPLWNKAHKYLNPDADAYEFKITSVRRLK